MAIAVGVYQSAAIEGTMLVTSRWLFNQLLDNEWAGRNVNGLMTTAGHGKSRDPAARMTALGFTKLSRRRGRVPLGKHGILRRADDFHGSPRIATDRNDSSQLATPWIAAARHDSTRLATTCPDSPIGCDGLPRLALPSPATSWWLFNPPLDKGLAGTTMG